MTFRDALTALSNLHVVNIQHNYDIDALPEALTHPQLPALLVMPIDTQDDRLFKDQGDGLQTIAFSGAGKTVNYTLTHLLILAPTTSRKGIRSHLPELVTLIDNYMSALATNPTLGTSLFQPARVTAEPGIFEVGKRDFYGCAFRHNWVIRI